MPELTLTPCRSWLFDSHETTKNLGSGHPKDEYLCGVDVPGGEQVPELHGEAGGAGGGHLRGRRGGAATAGHGGGSGEVYRLHCTKVDLFKVKIKI